jgi:hypothetical protein
MIMICTGEESPRTNNKKIFFCFSSKNSRSLILDSKQVGWLGDRASSSIFWRQPLYFFILFFSGRRIVFHSSSNFESG